MTTLPTFLRDERGASAAEFAMVLPLFLLLLFGIIDAGRYMWEYNRAEKATQMGVRYAVVTDMVLGANFANYSFSTGGGIPQGSAVPTTAFDSATCTSTTCSCSGGSVCSIVARDGTAFSNIVNRMALMYPLIQPANVSVEYRNVGLGFAGDPNGPDVAPLVTVQLQGVTFHPITCMLFACSFNLPVSRAALTLEDGSNNGLNPPIAN